jgi:hypothetical protein
MPSFLVVWVLSWTRAMMWALFAEARQHIDHVLVAPGFSPRLSNTSAIPVTIVPGRTQLAGQNRTLRLHSRLGLEILVIQPRDISQPISSALLLRSIMHWKAGSIHYSYSWRLTRGEPQFYCIVVVMLLRSMSGTKCNGKLHAPFFFFFFCAFSLSLSKCKAIESSRFYCESNFPHLRKPSIPAFPSFTGHWAARTVIVNRVIESIVNSFSWIHSSQSFFVIAISPDVRE